MKDIEQNGIWWLPGTDQARPGILRYTAHEGATLDLFSSFLGIEQLTAPDHNPEIVLGQNIHGHAITLFRCQEKSKTISLNNGGTASPSSYYVGIIIQGAHFPSAELIQFERVWMSFHGLAEWSGLSGISMSFEQTAQERLIHLKYKHPTTPKVLLEDGTAVLFNVNLTSDGIGTNEHHWREEVELLIESPAPRSMDEWFESFCIPLNMFLTLAMGKATSMSTLRVGGPRPADGRSEGKKWEVLVAAEPNPEKFSRRRQHEMLFTAPDILGDLESAIRNWLSSFDRLRPVYSLYTATIHNSDMLLQHEFLSLVQALETYHRRVHAELYMSEDDYQARVLQPLAAAIPTDIHPDLRLSLKNRITYGNEPSLRKRLRTLIRTYWPLLKPFIRDCSKFVFDVVEWRNYLTHYHGQSDRTIDEHLYSIKETLRIWVEFCLLHELGLTQETIKRLSERHDSHNRKRVVGRGCILCKALEDRHFISFDHPEYGELLLAPYYHGFDRNNTELLLGVQVQAEGTPIHGWQTFEVRSMNNIAIVEGDQREFPAKPKRCPKNPSMSFVHCRAVLPGRKMTTDSPEIPRHSKYRRECPRHESEAVADVGETGGDQAGRRR